MVGKSLLAVTVSLLTLSGCSPSNTDLNASVQNREYATYTPPKAANSVSSTSVKPKDGDVVSFTKINDTSQGTTLYELFYESSGQKVQAYVEVPQKSGKYPLLVRCHGGWTVPRPDLTHERKDWIPLRNIEVHPPNAVYLYPECQGYGDSDGTVQDTISVVNDIQNAITATMSATPSVSDEIYLYGVSMGGDAALLVASERKDVKAIVVDSPFLGMDSFMEWYQKLEQPQDLKGYYDAYVQVYGSDVHSKAYQEVSASEHIPSISAPVMVIEGTKDFSLWQPKKEFVDEMKKQGKTAEYVEIPGGPHAVTSGVPQAQDALDQWFKKYGFPDDVY